MKQRRHHARGLKGNINARALFDVELDFPREPVKGVLVLYTAFASVGSGCMTLLKVRSCEPSGQRGKERIETRPRGLKQRSRVP